MHARPRILRLAALLLACALPWAPLVRSAGADEAVARFLLDQAEKAIALRKYDEAVQKLERAREEDPALLEVLYELGKVHEKRKEPGEALRAYRAFRDACTARGEDLERADERLLARALRRIGVLGKGERELEKLEADFVERTLAFARKHREDDPDIAHEALRRLRLVAPDHEAATALFVELGGTAEVEAQGVEADESPIPGITRWVDLLASQAIPPGAKTDYEQKVLTFDAEGGSIFWTDPAVHAPEVFVYEMEFRFRKPYAPGYLIGPAFAHDVEATRGGGNEFVMAFAQRSVLTITHASGRKNIDIGQTAVAPIDVDVWHRLTIAVEERKVRMFFDGKRVMNTTIPGRKSLAGPIGVFHQRCIAEVRALRLGTKE